MEGNQQIGKHENPFKNERERDRDRETREEGVGTSWT